MCLKTIEWLISPFIIWLAPKETEMNKTTKSNLNNMNNNLLEIEWKAKWITNVNKQKKLSKNKKKTNKNK